MKHPSYSRASNYYAQRANRKLSKSSKELLIKEMKEFNKRLKKIEEKLDLI